MNNTTKSSHPTNQRHARLLLFVQTNCSSYGVAIGFDDLFRLKIHGKISVALYTRPTQIDNPRFLMRLFKPVFQVYPLICGPLRVQLPTDNGSNNSVTGSRCSPKTLVFRLASFPVGHSSFKAKRIKGLKPYRGDKMYDQRSLIMEETSKKNVLRVVPTVKHRRLNLSFASSN